MRVVNKSISLTRSELVTEIAEAIREEIFSINEYRLNNKIEVNIAFIDKEGKILGYEHYSIHENNYNLLMSENPTYAPDKPANEYRTEDLWHVIDLIRDEESSQ